MEMAIAHASSGLSKACFLNDKMKRTQDVCSLAMKVLNTTALKPELENIAAHLQAIYHQMINQVTSGGGGIHSFTISYLLPFRTASRFSLTHRRNHKSNS